MQYSCRSDYPSAPGSPKCRSQFGRSWLNSGPAFVDIGHSWPRLARNRPNMVECGPMFFEIGQLWSSSARGSEIGAGPKFVRNKPKLAELGNVANKWPRIAKQRPGNNRIGRFRRALASAGLCVTHIDHIRTSSADLGPRIRPKSLRLCPRLVQFWSTSVQSWS